VVARAQAEILTAPDAVNVSLVNSSRTAWGTLVAAPSTGRMVVAATGLPPAPAGREYRCWVQAGDTRTRLGTMWLADEVAWWAGPAPLPASLPPGTTFGVSLADVGGASVGDPVLLGTN
jgi:hypothetical protein